MKLIVTKPGGKAIVEVIGGLAVSSDRVLLYVALDLATRQTINRRMEPEEWVSMQVVMTGSDLQGGGVRC